MSGRAPPSEVAVRSVATSSTFSSPAWAGASTMAPDPGSSAAADGTAAPSQRWAPQPTPAVRTTTAVTASATSRSLFGRLRGGASTSSAGSSCAVPSVRPAWAAVRRVSDSSMRCTRVVASTGVSGGTSPFALSGARSGRSSAGVDRPFVRPVVGRSSGGVGLPLVRPVEGRSSREVGRSTGGRSSGETGLPLGRPADDRSSGEAGRRLGRPVGGR